jgi:hypothetical protein
MKFSLLPFLIALFSFAASAQTTCSHFINGKLKDIQVTDESGKVTFIKTINGKYYIVDAFVYEGGRLKEKIYIQDLTKTTLTTYEYKPDQVNEFTNEKPLTPLTMIESDSESDMEEEKPSVQKNRDKIFSKLNSLNDVLASPTYLKAKQDQKYLYSKKDSTLTKSITTDFFHNSTITNRYDEKGRLISSNEKGPNASLNMESRYEYMDFDSLQNYTVLFDGKAYMQYMTTFNKDHYATEILYKFHSDGRQEKFEFQYSENRISSILVTDPTTGKWTHREQFTYNEHNLVSAISKEDNEGDPTLHIKKRYDNKNRIVEERREYDSGLLVLHTWTYAP